VRENFREKTVESLDASSFRPLTTTFPSSDWNAAISQAAWIAPLFFLIIVVNFLPIYVYGEMEFWFVPFVLLIAFQNER